jgi:hypothetical protein
MLFCSRPLLAWMAKRWPIHEGEAEVLGELDRYLATGQLPTDARRLDVGAAEYAHGILQRLALEEERALERRAEQEERAREAMVRRVQEDAAEQERAWEERDRRRRLALANQQVRSFFIYTYRSGYTTSSGGVTHLMILYCTNWGLD